MPWLVELPTVQPAAQNVGESIGVLTGRERVHLIQVAVAPDHVKRISSDGPGRAQNGQRFHWRNRDYNIDLTDLRRKLRRMNGWQNAADCV